VNVQFSVAYSIRTLNATLSKMKVERTRDSINWTTLHDSATPVTTFTDNGLNSTIDNRPIDYRVTVIDSAGASHSVITRIQFQSYQNPVVQIFNIGSLEREKGDNEVAINLTIARTSVNIPIISYKIQYKLSTGDWVDVTTDLAVNAATVTAVHSHTTAEDIDFIIYRVLITDSQVTNYQGIQRTINFHYYSFFGTSTVESYNNVIDVEFEFANAYRILSDSKVRSVANVTASTDEYTWYWYKAADGDLTSCIMDGAAPVLGAFTKQVDITGINSLGANITLRGYRSNAKNAFTNNKLDFS
jgi:hypothetical protein